MSDGTSQTQVEDGLLSTAGPQLAASITSIRNQWLQYHNHKEQMAYVAAVVYIGSAATIATREDLAKQLRTWGGELSAALIAISAFLFVIWQLERLRVAQDTMTICNEALVGVESTRSSSPSALRLAAAIEGAPGLFPRRLLLAECVAILAMVIISVLAGLAILAT